MMEVYYQVIEGDYPFVTLCAVLYQGGLERNLTVLLTTLNSSLGETGIFQTFSCSDALIVMFNFKLAIPGQDYNLQSQTLILSNDESHNKSNTTCVKVAILDDDIPESEEFITIGMSAGSDDMSDVTIQPDRPQMIISILDDDHGMNF